LCHSLFDGIGGRSGSYFNSIYILSILPYTQFSIFILS